MKGINLQFDTLLQFIEKNSSNQQLLSNRQSFQLVYQKISQEALKIVGLVFQNIVDDHVLKLSFHKMAKQLKAFLALKPAVQQDEDDFFNHQFDQVQHFMNNRKPVMAQIDNSQRGDIVKFLFQAENKEKDIEEFMGNIKNIGGFSNAVKKLKTLKHLAVITEDIQTQTNMNMVYFERLQKRMPSLFKMDESTAKCNGPEIGSIQSRSEATTFDLDAQIQEMIKQKIKQAQELAEAQKLQKQKQKQREKQRQKQNGKQKTKSEKLQQQPKKKKSMQIQKRNSEAGGNKKSSFQPNHSNSFKAKSGFSVDKNSKKSLMSIVEQKEQKKQEKTAANTAQKFETCDTQLCDKSEQRRKSMFVPDDAKIQSSMPTFEEIFSSLAAIKGIEGISEQQLRIIYESIRSSTTQNLMKSSFFTKPITFQKQCNTSVTYAKNIVTDENGNIIEGPGSVYQNESSAKRKKGNIIKKPTIAVNWNQDKGEAEVNQISIEEDDLKTSQKTNQRSQVKSKSKSKGSRYDGEYKRGAPSDLLIEPSQPKISTGGVQIDGRSTNGFTRNGLPTLSKHIDNQSSKKIGQLDTANKLLKQGKSAEEILKKLKDSKSFKPLPQNKSLNKENYNLDMYKSKMDSKLRASQHNTNLPSLGRNGSNPKVGISLHEEGLKSPYLKKSTNTSSNDPLFPSTFTQSQAFYKKNQKEKGQRVKEISKQEQKIMKELERIVKEGAVKNNLKHIAMYVQFVESVHIRKCGERCVHLERFYDFLRRNNLPNRKELILHRTDMNVNVL